MDRAKTLYMVIVDRKEKMNARTAKLRTRLAAVIVGTVLLTGLLSGPVSADTQAPGSGLLVHNWWGEQMTLNIGFAQYHIPAYGSGFVPLAAGTYDLSVNVNGRDESSRDARVTIPAGRALDMSYWLHGLTFQAIDVVPPFAAAPTPPPPANANPNTAAPFDTVWHSIDAGQSLWYRVEIFSHDDEAFWLAMPNTLHTGINFEIYSGEQISRWWSETPISVGNVDGNGYNWGITGGGSVVVYVRVTNHSNQPSGFQFTYHGPLVTH